jgi:hypothetical protein
MRIAVRSMALVVRCGSLLADDRSKGISQSAYFHLFHLVEVDSIEANGPKRFRRSLWVLRFRYHNSPPSEMSLRLSFLDKTRNRYCNKTPVDQMPEAMPIGWIGVPSGFTTSRMASGYREARYCQETEPKSAVRLKSAILLQSYPGDRTFSQNATRAARF